jgi:hypothetical protein
MKPTKDTATLLFGDTIRARLVRLFATYDDKAFTLQECTIKTKAHAKGARTLVTNELASLVRARVLERKTVKNVHVWRLVVGAHTAAFPMLFEVSLRREENKRVEKLKKAGRLAFAAVGGKLLGDEFAPLDMLVVGNMHEAKLLRVLKALEGEYGREIQFMLLSEKEFTHRMDVRDRLLCAFFEHAHDVWVNKTKVELSMAF